LFLCFCYADEEADMLEPMPLLLPLCLLPLSLPLMLLLLQSS
jgi:hypothetical protein